ncbi:MAG: hypothetical protein V2A53_10230 [bacterium]
MASLKAFIWINSTTYKSNAKLTIEEELEGKREPMSQFERALEELGVDVVQSHPPSG